MRVPSFERFRKISAAGAVFVCGMVVGATVFNGLNNEAYNQVILDNYNLKQEIDHYKEQLNSLRSRQEQVSVIQTVRVFVVPRSDKPALDVVTETELKKQLKEDLAGMKGRRIYNIGADAQFAKNLLETKVYSGTAGNDYRVKITTMLVADGMLQVWVEPSLHWRP